MNDKTLIMLLMATGAIITGIFGGKRKIKQTEQQFARMVYVQEYIFPNIKL